MSAGPILIISGTNRPQSHAMKVARIVEGQYQAAKFPVEILSLTEMPREVFDGAAYATKPEGMVKIQQRVLDAAGLHIITPEYNGSFPGVLKYFIDMLKFPESFDHKPVAFVGEAMGMWAALRSTEQLIQIFGYRNAHIYPDRVLIPAIHTKLDAEGKMSDADILQRLNKQAVGFQKFAACFQASK